jgi:PAS domain S-box-containing protein
MRLDVRHPLPFYSKLLLENKILIFIALILAVLGTVVLGAQYWVMSRDTTDMLLEKAEAGLGSSLVTLAEAAAESDTRSLGATLDGAAARDDGIAYLLVSDAAGRPLASSANSASARSFLDSVIFVTAPEADTDKLQPGSFTERLLPLELDGEAVGTLRVGIEGKEVQNRTLTAVGIVAGLTALPVLLLFLAARAAVRHAVKPLKELTQVADTISTGDLNPRTDFGVRVNCWEIKNCQRTDCKAYLNISQQCWYIDGTPCEGFEPRFPQKLEACRECEVYQLHRGDEIVQLADAFKHMTAVLKESREEVVKVSDFQKRLINSSYDGIVATDADGVITIFNQVAEELIGISQEEVVGKRDWRAFFEDGLEQIMDLPLSHERFRRARGFVERESAILREDGTLVDCLLSGISLWEGGQRIGNVFFFQDMREVKRLRQHLIRSERLAATGQAAAGISHSIKNILDGFTGGAYVFKQGRRNDNMGKMDLGWDMIERNMELISDLVKDLLNFAQVREPEYRVVDPEALIDDVLVNMGVKENGRVKVRVKVHPSSRRFVLDPHAFHQCLTNLVRNAVEAIPEDREGEVTIETRVEGEMAIFEVRDDGMGMSPETVEKIKGGMYSTKGSKGTGLGLLVIQKIIEEHKGGLEIESEEGRGSTFRVELPVGGKPATA